jgi:hypothetical protein
MNRLLFLFCLLLPTLTLAQENMSHLIKAKVKQGSFLLGGTIHATVVKVTDEFKEHEGTKVNGFLTAKNGYFIWHDFVAGLDWTLNYESDNVAAIDKESKPKRETFMLMGPFVRYYLDNGFFGELTMQAGLHNYNYVDTGRKITKYDVYQGSIGVGYAHFINEKFSIEPILSFRYFRKTDDDVNYTTMGPLLGVGIQAYIIRKKAHVIKNAL